MQNRREQRECVFSLVYELDYNRDYDPASIYETALEERDIEQTDYIRETFFGVVENLDEIDDKIKEKSDGWKIDRISKVSMALMRLCTYEMLYANVPCNIAINEAIELVKKYDDEKVKGFMNGILNAIAKDSEK